MNHWARMLRAAPANLQRLIARTSGLRSRATGSAHERHLSISALWSRAFMALGRAMRKQAGDTFRSTA